MLKPGCKLAVTGHRPDKLGGFTWDNPHERMIRASMRNVFQRLLPTELYLGMALGVDTYAALEAIDLSIPFVAAVPCDGQEREWPNPADRDRYHELLEQAAKVHVVAPGPYRHWKMQARNEWMVDRVDGVLAVWNGSDGGTKNCVDYTKRVRKPVIRLHPERLR